MKFWWLIFVLLLAQCGVLAVAALQTHATGDGTARTGTAHPEHSTMLQGGPAPQRHADLLLPGWIFGSLQIVLFVALLTLGLGPAPQAAASGRRLVFASLGLIYVAVFTAVILLYGQQWTTDQPLLWFSFPRATLVMLLVLWPLPLVFVVLYSVLFPSWIHRRSGSEP